MAEAVMRYRIKKHPKQIDFITDSAGTHSYHVGEAPDFRTIRMCHENGISSEGITARQFSKEDFGKFDLLLGMDKKHVAFMKEAATPQDHPKIHLFMEYAGLGKLDVPDPYYGEMEDFLQVYEMVSKGTESILDMITREIQQTSAAEE